MPAPGTLILFISDWGVPASLQKPFLTDLVASYPLKMITAPEPVSLRQTYATFGTVFDTHNQPLVHLQTLLNDSGIKQTRIADGDRFGLLTQTFDGPFEPSASRREDVCIPFPPGNTLVEAYDTTLTLFKKRVMAQIGAGNDQVIFASMPAVWTAGMYQNASFLDAMITQGSNLVTQIVDFALDYGYQVLLVGDTEPLMPCLWVHPDHEGVRVSGHDISDGRDLPRQPSGHARQFGSTVAALLHIPLPAHAQPSLFVV